MPTKLITKQNLLDTIALYLPENPIIIEAGAFDGNDTKKLSRKWPRGIVHTFEPVPEIFTLLSQNTIICPNVRRYQHALSNKNGTATFYVSEKPNKPGHPFQAGSLHKPKDRLAWSDVSYPATITVPTYTLEQWAEQYNIDHIDFLWLDVQGHELNVMQSAPQLLQTVKVIYTEVNFGQVYESQPMYEDIKNWLAKRGFVEIARDFVDQHKWFFGNVLFVKQSLIKHD